MCSTSQNAICLIFSDFVAILPEAFFFAGEDAIIDALFICRDCSAHVCASVCFACVYAECALCPTAVQSWIMFRAFAPPFSTVNDISDVSFPGCTCNLSHLCFFNSKPEGESGF